MVSLRDTELWGFISFTDIMCLPAAGRPIGTVPLGLMSSTFFMCLSAQFR